jgi:hypothetical protein
VTAVRLGHTRRSSGLAGWAVVTTAVLVLGSASVAVLGERAVRPPAAVPAPGSATVAFVVALKTFEDSDVALADQAAAESTSLAVRSAATLLARHGDEVGAKVWAVLDRWNVPGVDRLPAWGNGAASAPSAASAASAPSAASAASANPTLVLHHDCTVYVNDELAHLSVLTGAGFDRRFVADWVGHATTALQSLETARWDRSGAPRLSAPGLREAVAVAESDLGADLATVRPLD